MKKIFMFLPVAIMVMTACAGDKAGSLSTGKEYFQYIDEKKFDLAYGLISDEDKQFFDVATFSQAMNDFYKHMYYPPGLDKESKVVVARMPDNLIEKFAGKGINYFKENKKVFIVREVRKVPDVNAIKGRFGNNANITGKMILDVLVTGQFPMRLDSSRFAIVAVEKGRPRVVVGARYVKTHESLLKEYEAYLKKNLVLSIVGKGYVYRTPKDSVLGIIKYNLVNNTSDTLSALSVKGQFKDRVTNDTVLYAPPSGRILPGQTITDRVVFSDPFLLLILGYYYSRMNVKADITISRYPVTGNGPYFDLLIESKPNAALTEFTNPIIQGAGGF